MSDYDSPWNKVGATVSDQGASIIQLESNKAIPFLIALMGIAVVLGALALGMALGAKDQSFNTEARVRGDILKAEARIMETEARMRSELTRMDALIIREQQRIDRETRLQRLETDELKSAFMNAGLKTHLETDSP